MNRFKTLAIGVALMLGALSANAQKDNTFSFIDEAGNEVPDGSTVTFYAEKHFEVPGLPEFGYSIQSDYALKVRNNTNAEATVSLHVKAPTDAEYIGAQICFPGECGSQTKGEFDTEPGKMAPNEVRVLKSEFIFENQTTPNVPYGTADVSLTLMHGTQEGPTVNIRSIYADPTGITDIESDVNATVVGRYDANGRKLDAPKKGLNIVKLSNGKTIKTVEK